MKAGRRDRRITIERKTATQNTYGEEIVTWATLTTVWADMRPVTGRESYTENQFQSFADTKFRVLYSNVTRTLTTEDRVTYRGRTYDIVSVNEIGRLEGIEILAYTQTEDQVSDVAR